MVSFLANPTREATTPGGDRWQIRIVRGSSWRGWPGQARILRFPSPLDPWRVNRRTTLEVYATVPRVVLWAAYRLRGRSEWCVVVRPASSESDDDAVLDEQHPTKEQAARRAADLLATVRDGRWDPSAPSEQGAR